MKLIHDFFFVFSVNPCGCDHLRSHQPQQIVQYHPNKILRGNLHQGDHSKFSHRTVGRQCVSNCVVALSFASTGKQWTNLHPDDLRNVLMFGDKLHTSICQEIGAYRSITLTEVPKQITVHHQKLNFEIASECCGIVCKRHGIPNNLEQRLLTLVQTDTTHLAVLILGSASGEGSASAVVVSPGRIHLFDPHARSPTGMPHANGTCFAITFGSVSDFIGYLSVLSTQLHAVVYEFTTVNISKYVAAPKSASERKQKQRSSLQYDKESENKSNQKRIQSHRKSSAYQQKEREHSKQRQQKRSEQQRVRRQLQFDEPPLEVTESCDLPSSGSDEPVQHNDANIKKAQVKFEKAVKDQPIFVCVVCHRLLYKHSVKSFSINNYDTTHESVAMALRADNLHSRQDYICNTCHLDLKRKNPRVPAQACANGLQLQDVPEVLTSLNDLERRFISMRIPFMKLVSLPRGGQYGINGPCVNVPSELTSICNVLPRLPQEIQLVHFKLKRRLKYKGHHMSAMIRPRQILAALFWLKENNPLYKDIVINDNWEEQCQTHELWSILTGQSSLPNASNDISNTSSVRVQMEMSAQCNARSTSTASSEREINNPQQDQQRNETSQPASSSELADHELQQDQQAADVAAEHTLQPFNSCLQIDDIERVAFSVAPGEGQKPKYILTDEGFETLGFPDLFPYGTGDFHSVKNRPRNLNIRRYFNQRILNVDGRFAQNIEYLLASQYATELKQVYGNIGVSLCLRRGKLSHGNRITAGMLRSTSNVHEMMYKEQAFKFLQTVRGTPQFWAKMTYEVLAMLKQLGVPTFFITLSADDYHWPEIIQTIAHQYGHSYTDEEVSSMTWGEKSKWLRTNPVTAVRAFMHRHSKIHEFIMGKSHPIGVVKEFVHKVEFQARGSPHIHSLYWIENAPVLGKDSDEQVSTFIGKHISARVPDTNSPLHELVTTRQHHSCSNYCRRKGGSCRFGYEKPPSYTTFLSEPPEDERAKYVIERSRTILRKLREVMAKYPEKEFPGMHLDEMLRKSGLNIQTYTEALKHAYKTTTIVLQRHTRQECRTNPYNKYILEIWKANMDIQFVENAISAVMYVCSYMMKAEKGMGELLKRVCKEVQQENIRDQMNQVGKAFLGSREVSAQEAVMRILSMPLIKKSRTVIFVDTTAKDKRVARLQFNIKDKEDDDDDIFCTTIHDRYASRPAELENLCLAKFAVTYAVRASGSDDQSDDAVCEQPTELNDDLPQGFTPRNSRKQPRITLSNNLGTMVQCLRPQVLRVHKVNKEKDPIGYQYSRLLLFHPWRDEDSLMQNTSDLHEQFFNQIEFNAQEFNCHEDEVDSASQLLADTTEQEHLWDSVCPSTQQLEGDANIEGVVTLRNLDEATIQEEQSGSHDVTVDTTNNSLGKLFTVEAHKHGLSTRQYKDMFRTLNKEQREFVLYNRQWCKDSIAAVREGKQITPYHVFLSGPGGTGKSHVISMVHRDINHFFRQAGIGSDDDPLVLLTAFTGTAAFNISGITLHSALCLPTTGNPRLSHEKLTTLQMRLQHLKLLIIDEISMISLTQLMTVHERLCSCKQVNLTTSGFFAGTSVLAVGDFYQLRPVGGTPLCVARTPRTVDEMSPTPWSCFKFHELTQIMRQAGDDSFSNMLNAVRTSTPLPNSAQDLFLQTLQIPDNKADGNYPRDWMHVFAQNKHAHAHNASMLESMEGILHSLPSQDSAKDGHTRLSNVRFPDEFQKTGRLVKNLQLKIGARVMLTNNVDIPDGLTNGAMGKVTHIIYKDGKASHVLVKFDDERVGVSACQRSRFKHHCQQSVPISRIQASFPLGGKRTCEGTRIQFPIVLSWAVTIHKVQGLTLGNIVVDMDKKKGRFGFGQAYVALSRVRKSSSLKILNYDREQIKSDPQVDAFMETMRTIPIVSSVHEHEIQPGSFRCMLVNQNVENMRVHSHDIDSDKTLCNGDILCFTETHLHADDVWPLTHITSETHTIYRVSRTSGKGGGLAVCVKKGLQSYVHTTVVTTSSEVLCVHIPDYGLTVIAVYRPPRGHQQDFSDRLTDIVDALPHGPCVVAGDFNINHVNGTNTTFTQLLTARHFNQVVKKATTDQGTLLDHIYLRELALTACIVRDCYYSYHDKVECYID